MNLHNICLQCSNEIEYIGKKFIKDELGFKIPVKIYQCKNCGSYFIECPNCNGKGFDESLEYLEDCVDCKGFGIIQIEKSLLFES